ncbi:MAG: hypothetical protein IT370_13315 [Deltaproteobacteria bacterium]|nr:hypothetical protein [Deltaproteobacteria bacterium]
MARRPVLIAAMTVLLALGAAVGYWRWRARSRQPEAFITAVTPLEGGGALLLWHKNRMRGGALGWVSSLDETGRLRWARALPDLPAGLLAEGPVLAGGVVVTRYGYYAETLRLVGHALADGARRWDVPLLQPHARGTVPVLSRAQLLGDRLLQWINESEPAQGADARLVPSLRTLDPETGRELARAPAPSTPVARWSLGQRLFVHETETLWIYEPARAQPLQLASPGGGCVVGADYITILELDAGPALVTLKQGDPTARHIIKQGFHPVGDPGSFQALLSCGRHGDRLLFALEASVAQPGGAISRGTSVVVTDLAGDTLHELRLATSPAGLDRGLTMRDAPSAPLSGELPRFALFVTTVPGAGLSQHRLELLDVEAARVVWQGRPDSELARHGRVFRVGQRWLAVLGDGVRVTLVLFDGDSGALSAAVEVASPTEIIWDVMPEHVAGGKLWLASMDITALDAPALAVLDTTSLRPLRVGRPLRVTDVTAAVRAELGYPGSPFAAP